jgi:hypothetical protein
MTTESRSRAAPIWLLSWYFMTMTVMAGGAGVQRVQHVVATQGPFNSSEQCEWARGLITNIGTTTSPCWSDGR